MERQLEHGMGEYGTGTTAGDLRKDEGDGLFRPSLAAP